MHGFPIWKKSGRNELAGDSVVDPRDSNVYRLSNVSGEYLMLTYCSLGR